MAHFSGYVSEHSAKHYGEASLQGTIIRMAQDFCGSKNMNLLEPIGQFGTRKTVCCLRLNVFSAVGVHLEFCKNTVFIINNK